MQSCFIAISGAPERLVRRLRMRKTMQLLSGFPAAGGEGTATKLRVFSVLLAFCFFYGGSVSLAAAQTSQEPGKPLWQTKLSVTETDFIEFTSKNRVLVGTVNTADMAGGLQPHEIMLLNSVTGEKLWAVPRGSFGSPQTLLAVDPVILIEGSKQIVALNPENGTVLWSRERAGERYLLLPAQNLMVFLARKAAPMTISAVNVKTGSEAWKIPIENYPVDKGTRLDLSIMGDTVLLSGPETAAFSATDGKLMWRMPFPGTFGLKAAAIPLGDDLYFSDSSAIVRFDPASGKQIWRAAVSDGAFQALTADEYCVFILLKGSGKDLPDSIEALDRNTGKQFWSFVLPDRAASPISIDANVLYLTTPANVIALSALDGSVTYKTTIPPELQSRRQLPDIVRIASDRIIVAREDGVLAVGKFDGKLLFADQVVGGKGFTFDYSTAMFRRASATSHRAQLNSDSASPEDNYRVAMAQQHMAYDAIRAFNQRSMNQTNLILYGTSQPTFQQQQQAGTAVAVTGAAIGVGMAAVSALNVVVLTRIADTFRERVQHTYQTHASSLRDKFYIRPSYDQRAGWSLFVVNLETGDYASVPLTPDSEEAPNQYAAHLPAFSTDGTCIVSKGIGPDAELIKMHKGLMLNGLPKVGAYPSVLGFDPALLSFTKGSNIPAANSVSPEKSKLNEQLLEAASRNDLDAARQSLDAGADVNAVDAYGYTVLMIAAEASVGTQKNGLSFKTQKAEVIDLLLERGANAELRDPSGLTALEHAIPLMIPPGAWNLRAIKDIEKAQKKAK